MGVYIDEPWSDGQAAGVQGFPAGGNARLALSIDGFDPAPGNDHIALETGRTASVDDPPTSNQKIAHLRFISIHAPRGI